MAEPVLLWSYADFQRHYGSPTFTVDKYGGIYTLTYRPMRWSDYVARWLGRALAWLAVGHAVHGARRG